jgi:hypothetical protein
MMGAHPASAYHERRRLVFGTYRKRGYEDARAVARQTSDPRWRAGLLGELLVLDRYKNDMQLNVLIDVGEKADLTGVVDGRAVNIDVTTNLDYKDINKYAEVSQKEGKTYYIAHADLKSEEIELFPLRFPYCEACRSFAHHILFFVPSMVESHSMSEISDDQRVITFCPSCGEIEERSTYNYLIRHLSTDENELREYAHESGMYTEKQVEEKLLKDRIATVEFFETESNLLLSGLAENTYVITDPRDADGYWAGGLHWKHPLVRNLQDEIDVYFGTWG